MGLLLLHFVLSAVNPHRQHLRVVRRGPSRRPGLVPVGGAEHRVLALKLLVEQVLRWLDAHVLNGVERISGPISCSTTSSNRGWVIKLKTAGPVCIGESSVIGPDSVISNGR